MFQFKLTINCITTTSATKAGLDFVPFPKN